MVKSTVSENQQQPDDANTAANAIRVFVRRYDEGDLEATKVPLELLGEVLSKRGCSIVQSTGAVKC
ncbi:hypothetical protein [Thalassoglobus sp.]|uniref:hypothetical protein n=1 Tax=Thalassoglobus sp. TaxID=2795869 RepID=UPI003AA83A2D